MIKQIQIIALILGIATCILKIQEPQEAVQHYLNNDQQIQYILAKFGDVHYGKLYESILKISDPIDGCKMMKPLALQGGSLPFVLIQRGNCTYTEKVENAQLAGASLAIIYDDKASLSNEPIRMIANSQAGIFLNIPSISIGKEDGSYLLQLLKSGKQVTMQYNFELSENIQIFDMFLDIRHPQTSFTVVREFIEFQEVITDHYDFQVTFFLQSEASIINQTQDPNKYENCYGGGLYCLSSRSEVAEVIFQRCLAKIDLNQWFHYNYIAYLEFKKSKLLTFDWDNFRNYELGKYSLTYNQSALDKCINESYVNPPERESPYISKNRELDEILDTLQFFQPQFFPVFSVNNEIIYVQSGDSVTSDKGLANIVYQMCKKSFRQSIRCIHIIQEYEIQIKDDHKNNHLPDYQHPSSSNLWWVHMLVVFLILFIFLAFAFFYRRRMRIYYESQSEKVGELVQDYYKLHQANLEQQSKENDKL